MEMSPSGAFNDELGRLIRVIEKGRREERLRWRWYGKEKRAAWITN